jgi:hypothetical protein
MIWGVQVHLVDGTFELFRCFHGAPRARGADGREVGAARGLLATFVALLNEPGVSHVAVAFDAVIPPAGMERAVAGEAVGAGRVPKALHDWPSSDWYALASASA